MTARTVGTWTLYETDKTGSRTGRDMVWEFVVCLAKHKHRLGRDREQPSQDGLGNGGGSEAGHESVICSCSPENKSCPGLHQKRHGQQVEAGHCPPLLCSLRPCLQCCIQVCSPSIRRMWTCRTSPDEARKMIRAGLKHLWTPEESPMRTGWDS